MNDTAGVAGGTKTHLKRPKSAKVSEVHPELFSEDDDVCRKLPEREIGRRESITVQRTILTKK